MKKGIYLLIFVLSVIFSQQSCKKNKITDTSDLLCTGTFDGEYIPSEDWRTCKPEEVGMDSEILSELDAKILEHIDKGVDIHSVLIVKEGYITAEKYYSEEYTQDSLHPTFSCTKSITSALTGIAIDNGFIEDENEKVLSFFPDIEIENAENGKEDMTIKHALMMSCGLEWNEFQISYDDDLNDYNQMIMSGDRTTYILNKEMNSLPGEEFCYNTGISHILSEIIQRTSNTRTDSFAVEHLFQHIGIKNFKWFVEPNGVPAGGHGMSLTARNMAKFGYLYLKMGKWGNKQIVPEQWIDKTFNTTITANSLKSRYGYHWWIGSNNTYCAIGYSGQWIMVVPEKDMVVVFNNNFDDDVQWQIPEALYQDYIIKAVK